MFGLKIVKAKYLSSLQEELRDVKTRRNHLKNEYDRLLTNADNLKKKSNDLNKSLKDSMESLAKKNKAYNDLRETCKKYQAANKSLATQAEDAVRENAAMRIYIESLTDSLRQYEAAEAAKENILEGVDPITGGDIIDVEKAMNQFSPYVATQDPDKAEEKTNEPIQLDFFDILDESIKEVSDPANTPKKTKKNRNKKKK